MFCAFAQNGTIYPRYQGKRAVFVPYQCVSALETDGTMHTYIVAYEESPSRLILDYRDMPPAVNESKTIVRSSSTGKVPHRGRRLYHVTDKEYGITFFCDDIYVENDISTFSLCLENKSGIRYDCSDAIFVVENRKSLRRGLVYEKQQSPIGIEESLSTPSGKTSHCTFRLDKLYHP